jgi:hypothetical protein
MLSFVMNESPSERSTPAAATEGDASRKEPNDPKEDPLEELQNCFGAEAWIVIVPPDDPLIIRDCRPGWPKQSDFRKQPRPSFPLIRTVECGRMGETTLCGVEFTSRSEYNWFGTNNPIAMKTRMTQWFDCVVMWFKVKGKVPRNLDLPGCSFWSSGRIPVGLPGKPLQYFTVSAGEIQVIEFNQLR